MASIYQKNDKYLKIIKHGIDFLRKSHLDKKTGGYAWILDKNKASDSTNYCYGLAFVLLAYSSAYKAGVLEVKEYIQETFDLMERHFWDKDFGLYSDEISANWSELSDYRGQNANMHSCEALIAAFEATKNKKYLDLSLIHI